MTIVYIGAASVGFALAYAATGSLAGAALLACVAPAVVAALVY